MENYLHVLLLVSKSELKDLRQKEEDAYLDTQCHALLEAEPIKDVLHRQLHIPAHTHS